MNTPGQRSVYEQVGDAGVEAVAIACAQLTWIRLTGTEVSRNPAIVQAVAEIMRACDSNYGRRE
eukprot:6195641-Pleurochrysis_carterae.AAC.1